MEGLEKKLARPAPRNPQAGRLGESRLSPGDAGLAEAEFDAEGSLREFPFLEDCVAAEMRKAMLSLLRRHSIM